MLKEPQYFQAVRPFDRGSITCINWIMQTMLKINFPASGGVIYFRQSGCCALFVLICAGLVGGCASMRHDQPGVAFNVSRLNSESGISVSVKSESSDPNSNTWYVHVESGDPMFIGPANRIIEFAPNWDRQLRVDQNSGAIYFNGSRIGDVSAPSTVGKLVTYTGEVGSGRNRVKFKMTLHGYPFEKVIWAVLVCVGEYIPSVPDNIDEELKQRIDRAYLTLIDQAKSKQSDDYKRYRIDVNSASGLVNIEGIGWESDPYVNIEYDGHVIFRSCDNKNTLSPEWEDAFVVFDYLEDTPIRFNIWDGNLGEDELMSSMTLERLVPYKNAYVLEDDNGQSLTIEISESKAQIFLSPGTCPVDSSKDLLKFLKKGLKVCECIAMAVLPPPVTIVYEFISEVVIGDSDLKEFVAGQIQSSVLGQIATWLDGKAAETSRSSGDSDSTPDSHSGENNDKIKNKYSKSIPYIEAIYCILLVLAEDY